MNYYLIIYYLMNYEYRTRHLSMNRDFNFTVNNTINKNDEYYKNIWRYSYSDNYVE